MYFEYSFIEKYLLSDPSIKYSLLMEDHKGFISHSCMNLRHCSEEKSYYSIYKPVKEYESYFKFNAWLA